MGGFSSQPQNQAAKYKLQAEQNQAHLRNQAELKKQAESSGSEGAESEVYYDEMDYDDELNDQEERDYKRELQNKQYELPKRATRGLRMQALVGKAQEEDDAFYAGIFGAEGVEDSDQSFNSRDESVDSGRDSFDSDFGRSESDDKKSDGSEEEKAEREIRGQERREVKKTVRFHLKKPKAKKAAGDQIADKDAAEGKDDDKQSEDLRRSKRITDKDPIPVLKKRTATEADLTDKPKRPKPQKSTAASGSLADKQFTQLTSEDQNWQSLLQKSQLTPLEMM